MEIKRTKFTQLPEGQELQNILSKEAKRPVPKEKQNKHYPDFSSAIQLLRKYSLSPDIFTQEWTSRDSSIILKQSKILISKLTETILNSRQSKASRENISLFDKVYDYLAQEDPLEKADLIFVFGAKTLFRVEKGVELYQKKLANLLMLSGGHPSYKSNPIVSEAEIYKEFALEKGIPDSNIITEDKSITMPDNVKRSLNLLDEKAIHPHNIILVNSPYNQRRGWAHFKKYTPKGVKLIRVNCKTGPKYSKENWYKNEDGIRAVINSFVKMKIAVILNSA